MRKIVVVAVREYQAAVRTKAFIISMLAMPVFMGGSILVQVVMKDKVDTKDKRIAIVDHTGLLYGGLVEAAKDRNENENSEHFIFKGTGDQRQQVKPRYLLEQAQPASTTDDQTVLSLSQRVRDGEFFAFVIIGPNVIHPGKDADRASVAYHSNNPTHNDLRRWASGALNKRIQALRLADAHIDPEVVGRAMTLTPVANLGLVSVDEAGQITEAKESNEVANFMVPFGMLMLMFMVVMLGASPLVQSVLEEKMQRIAEVLLGSIPPFQLMLGKLLGMVGVSLTIATVYLGGAFFAIHQSGFGQFFPGHLVIWFVVFQGLAVLLYGSVFIAIGAAVSDMKEAQSIMMPVMLVVMAPMFVWINVIREPMATSSVVLSLIPPATPMLMILRQAVPPGVPLWQPLLGVVLVLLTTLLCVFAAGRIFRVGILMQGKGAKIGDMLRWVIRG